jgi:hypothetical protein
LGFRNDKFSLRESWLGLKEKNEMANFLSGGGGVPALNTNYGPDFLKVATAAKAMKEMQDGNLLRQAAGEYKPGAGVDQAAMGNILSISPEMGAKLLTVESRRPRPRRSTESRSPSEPRFSPP